MVFSGITSDVHKVAEGILMQVLDVLVILWLCLQRSGSWLSAGPLEGD